MTRVAVALMVAVTGLALAAPALAPPALAQVGFDRRGGDYQTFAVRSGDPALCAARCDRDNRCRAWSFSYPTRDRGAECRLKTEVPPRVEDAATASGVRGAGVIQPRHASGEYSIDRPGGDYRSVDAAGGEACKSACEADAACRAFTFVRPGYAGPDAKCWLKNRLMPPRHRPCCISGVVR